MSDDSTGMPPTSGPSPASPLGPPPGSPPHPPPGSQPHPPPGSQPHPPPGSQPHPPPAHVSEDGRWAAAAPARYSPGPPAYGAGGPAAWQQPLFQAYKPGIIRLQALGLGDILDGAVRAVRFNPKSMIGMSVLVLATFLLPSAALSAASLTLLRSSTVDSQMMAALSTVPASLGSALFGGLATVLLTGLLIHVVGEAVLGRRPGLGETWRATRGRLLPLLGLNVLLSLALGLSFAIVLAPGFWLAFNDQLGAGVATLLLGGLLATVAATWVGIKVLLAGPVLVLERTGIRTALRRSWQLTTGSWWRLFGIYLLAAVIASVVTYILQVPFSIVVALTLGLSGTGFEEGLLGAAFVQHLSTLVSGALTTPFLAAVVGLLYIDRRIRREALDVSLVKAAQSGP